MNTSKVILSEDEISDVVIKGDVASFKMNGNVVQTKEVNTLTEFFNKDGG